MNSTHRIAPVYLSTISNYHRYFKDISDSVPSEPLGLWHATQASSGLICIFLTVTAGALPHVCLVGSGHVETTRGHVAMTNARD